MVNITIYGGCGEVGGNQILLNHADTNILLDFGARMGYDSDFFAEFLGVRTNTALRDKLTIGSIPRIPGIYRGDLASPVGLEDIESEYARVLGGDSSYFGLPGLDTYEEHRDKTGKKGADAIFVTHAHLDHVGAIGFLHPAIPMYCSRDTETLIRAIDDVTSFKSAALTMKENLLVATGNKGNFPGSPTVPKKKPVYERPCNTLEDGESATLGASKITLLEVDHSVPGAASFVVEAEGKKILYTGDIRFHGTRPLTIDEYASKVGPGVDLMLCEGTRIGAKVKVTEDEVGRKILDRVRSTEGTVFIEFSWKDPTRYETILKACKEAGRTFVINARLAYLLERFGTYPADDPGVKVFLKRKASVTYSPSDYSKQKYEYGLSVDWDDLIDSTHYDNGIVAEDIGADPGKYVLMLSFYDLGQIFDLADDDGHIPGSWFIKAQCEPFSDEMEIDEERMINWLNAFEIGYDEGEIRLPDGCENEECPKIRGRIDRSHVSGHASGPELKELIARIAPKKLIPMHTGEPERFVGMVGEINEREGMSIEVVLPERGRRYGV